MLEGEINQAQKKAKNGNVDPVAVQRRLDRRLEHMKEPGEDLRAHLQQFQSVPGFTVGLNA